jgi:Metallo-peptidase family M12B Reprolysin-like
MAKRATRKTKSPRTPVQSTRVETADAALLVQPNGAPLPAGVKTEASPPQPALATAPSPAVLPVLSGTYAEVMPNRGEFRLDVDGANPQMTASGDVVNGLTDRLHWVAKIAPIGEADEWQGDIWYRDGTDALVLQTSVHIIVDRTVSQREAKVRFSGGGLPDVTRVYRRTSAFFHPVEFEFDAVEGTTALTAIDSCAHPNKPLDLPCERLTIETVFRRAGFDVSVTPSVTVPLAAAGADRRWSNTEMHDAMQQYWSHFSSSAHWALWVLFASLHEDGSSLGGIMFDSIGANQRQGTAIFNDAFISQAPAGDQAPAAWVQRMRFWTACHEMGHGFNLAHSWQETAGESWIPLKDEPEGRTFMNYPYRVQGGQTAFFSDFAYRFSDQELLFMRHGPERFVEMGAAPWFDNHGFSQAESYPEPKFKVEIRVNRPDATFEFMEPCTLEVKLTNVTDEPQLVSERVIRDADRMTVITKKQGQPARQWHPFAQYCYKARHVVLEAGASIYESLFVGAGRNGWDLAEPGRYAVQAVVQIGSEDFVSNQLAVRVKPPRNYDEENLAQDLFTDDVGRVLAFEGSRVLGQANDMLREVATRFSDRPVANHALVALGWPLMRDSKVLKLPAKQQSGMEPAADVGGQIAVVKAQPDQGKKDMTTALFSEPERAAQTLGHIDYKSYADELSHSLAGSGDKKAAAKIQGDLLAVLQARKVAPHVLAQVENRRDEYATT